MNEIYQPHTTIWQARGDQTEPANDRIPMGTPIAIEYNDTIIKGSVLNAFNYGNNGIDDWAIEIRDADGYIRYWLQSQDGGHLLVPMSATPTATRISEPVRA